MTQHRTFRVFNSGGKPVLDRANRAALQPAPHQVLIQVGAASLNYRDLLTIGDTSLPASYIPLSDAAGTVIAVGSAVTLWKVGDRVSPNFFASWKSGKFSLNHIQSALGGGNVEGVLADQVLAHEQAVTAVPEHLTLAEAATLPCAALTAWQALFERSHITAGDTVLVQGTGGVALFGLQLAKAIGARVIVTSSSDEKLERARALGAWQTINYRKQPEWDKAALELTDGKGVDHILELGGQDTYNRSINAIGYCGHINQIGVLTGFGSAPNVMPLTFKNAEIHGICVGSGEHFANMNRFISEHKIKPVIDRQFGFDDTPQAYDYLRAAGHFGKIVISL